MFVLCPKILGIHQNASFSISLPAFCYQIECKSLPLKEIHELTVSLQPQEDLILILAKKTLSVDQISA